MRKALLTIWISCLLCACSTAQPSDEPPNGWELSQEAYNSAYIDSLKVDIRKNVYRQINSVVVIKDGKLLIEEYFNGADRNQTHNPRSVGKTFASAVLGIALEEGYIPDVNQPLSAFYDLRDYHHSDKKQQVTLEHLLTMSSGFAGDDSDPASPGNEENMYPQDNWVEWTLNLPMAETRQPGEEWAYFTAGVVVLGDVIDQSVPGGLEAYAHEKLFRLLGITHYQWQHTPQEVANTAGGIQLTPLDFAKFGQLYLADGQWEGQPVLPKKWVKASLTRQYETTYDGNGYGYLWWNKQYQVGDESLNTFYCSGNGGNKIFIFPELNAVVVITASAYGQSYAHPQVDDMMVKYILPALL